MATDLFAGPVLGPEDFIYKTVTITKRGVPVAKLVPVSEEKMGTVFGSLRGCVAFEKDIVSPIGDSWNADE